MFICSFKTLDKGAHRHGLKLKVKQGSSISIQLLGTFNEEHLWYPCIY